ncbi:MAG: sulfatase [Acidobacteria bacterium]|nr:sulfatase [Acidobacteriota bacterium]MBI3280170.1 sulfatase [Acidobacteriota bacterium]
MPNPHRRDFLGMLATAAPQAARRPPNVVFVLVDDLRWDELGCMGHPSVRTPQIDRLAREGALFRNAFHTTPLCSPSRACFLTGQYAHTHGIVDNTARTGQSHRLSTFPRLLHEAGYETAYIGKWHMGNDDSPRPGFDRWISFPGQGTYLNPTLNDNGRTRRVSGYVTDIFTDLAVEFIRARRKRPFCLYLAHKALHPEIQQRDDGSIEGESIFIPAERHRSLYATARIPRRPSYARAPSGKPALERSIGSLPPLGPRTVTDDETIRNRWRELMAVDEGLGRLLTALDERRLLEDTLVILAGDNGYFYGEHGLSHERRLAYEESIRMPLVMRYPRRIRAGSRFDQLALGIDVAPTILETAGVSIPPRIEGRSLLPLWGGNQQRWRESFLVEYFSDRVFPRILNMGYQAVRTSEWKYIHYTELDGMDELYNLRLDPYEVENRIHDAAAGRVLDGLKAEMAGLLQKG